jgi:TetR/AcrR family transcriptional regulator, upper aerobic nicotinate degradation pathway regulator
VCHPLGQSCDDEELCKAATESVGPILIDPEGRRLTGVTRARRAEVAVKEPPAKAIAKSTFNEPGAAVRVRKPRARSSEVAEALKRAALDLFAQQNYSTVTIKDIAAATGINSALIYYYFGSKEDLFLRAVETTVEEAFRKFDDVRASAQSPDTIIAVWIEIHILQFVLLQKLAKISLDYASTRNRTARIDRAIRIFYDKEQVVLGEAIQAGIVSGLFRPVDPERMSVFISTFLDGCLFRSVMFPRFAHRRAIEDMRNIVLEHLRVR